jgi:hypothetical protein
MESLRGLKGNSNEPVLPEPDKQKKRVSKSEIEQLKIILCVEYYRMSWWDVIVDKSAFITCTVVGVLYVSCVVACILGATKILKLDSHIATILVIFLLSGLVIGIISTLLFYIGSRCLDSIKKDMKRLEDSLIENDISPIEIENWKSFLFCN